MPAAGAQPARIREYTPRDYAPLMRLWTSCRLPLKPHGRDSRERLEKELQNGPGKLWLAEENGRIIGAVLATHDFRKGWINRLAVDPSLRRRGLGLRLARLALNYLQNDCDLLISAILIEGDNPESVALFSRLGFKPHPDIKYYALRESDQA
ncbi:MAG TPA: GNAT family N-acetyltransferase [Candidatus Aminicenantes bacterium]|nr:GNAT family N-acetyltransferase [Candidatus Aminicenantes bacterium]